MFKLVPLDKPVKWPVKVNIPRDGGQTQNASFIAHFLVLRQDELADIQNEADFEWAKRVIVGWETVSDEDGNELPFSEEALERLIGITYVREAVQQAYYNCINGRAV